MGRGREEGRREVLPYFSLPFLQEALDFYEYKFQTENSLIHVSSKKYRIYNLIWIHREKCSISILKQKSPTLPLPSPSPLLFTVVLISMRKDEVRKKLIS